MPAGPGHLPEVKPPSRLPRHGGCAHAELGRPLRACALPQVISTFSHGDKPGNTSFYLWWWVGFAIHRLLLQLSVESLVIFSNFDPKTKTGKVKW